MKIINFRKTSLLLLATVALFAAMMVAPQFQLIPTAKADSDYLMSSFEYTFGTFSRLNLQVQHPSSNSYRSAIAQTFNATRNWYLAEVHLWLKEWQPVDFAGQFSVRIEGVGADGLAGSPNGTIYATATNSLDLVELTSTATEYTFDFNLSYQFVANGKYAVVGYVSDGSGINVGTGLWPTVGYKGSSPPHQGQCCYFDNSAWTEVPTYDTYHEVWVSETGAENTGEEPTSGGYTSEAEGLITEFTSFIVPVLVTLLPAFLLVFITRSTSKWIILIGITIGVGLGYFFNLVPLWVVFLVTIGLIGMAYQSVRGGG